MTRTASSSGTEAHWVVVCGCTSNCIYGWPQTPAACTLPGFTFSVQDLFCIFGNTVSITPSSCLSGSRGRRSPAIPLD